MEHHARIQLMAIIATKKSQRKALNIVLISISAKQYLANVMEEVIVATLKADFAR